jgi:hypothetical protein
MIPNFPEHPTMSKGDSNAERMSFFREWLKDKDINTILELGRCQGWGSTWFFVESGAEVWSVDISGINGLAFVPEEQLGMPGGLSIGAKIGDGTNSFEALELLKFPTFHMFVADDTKPLPEIDDKTFDLVFLDTSHIYAHTVYELKRYYTQARKWFVVDDFHWGEGNLLRGSGDIGVYGACVESGLPFRFIGGLDVYAVDKVALNRMPDDIMKRLTGH